MSLIFDSIVDRVDRMGNAGFYQKANWELLKSIAGSPSLVMYAFQQNAGGVTVSDESGNGYSMTLSADTMWTGQGWYQHFGRMLQAGNKGYGLANTGGASALVATIPDGTLTRLNGKTKAHWKFKILLVDTGGGGLGRLIDKSPAANNNGWRLRVSAANTLLWEMWNGAGWVSNSTGANVVYGYWHDLDIWFDGSQVGDTNRLKMILNGRDVTTSVAAGIPAAISDTAMPIYILNNIDLNRAWNGRLGFFSMAPDAAETLVQAQSTIELRSLDQPTTANQPTIQTPGAFGGSQYKFDGAGFPNADYQDSYQIIPVQTAYGTVVIWFSQADLANAGSLFNTGTYGAAFGVNTDEFRIDFRGDVANDPIEIVYVNTGATVFYGAVSSIVNPAVNMFALTSDGATLRAYMNGVNYPIVVTAGVNAGQWFGLATRCNNVAIGVLHRAAPLLASNQARSKTLLYNRALTQIELQQIQNRGMGPNGPRWWPQS